MDMLPFIYADVIKRLIHAKILDHEVNLLDARTDRLLCLIVLQEMVGKRMSNEYVTRKRAVYFKKNVSFLTPSKFENDLNSPTYNFTNKSTSRLNRSPPILRLKKNNSDFYLVKSLTFGHKIKL